MSDHSHLWNDLSFDERERLMPYQLQAQMRHILQCKEIAMTEARLDDELKELERTAVNSKSFLKNTLKKKRYE